MSGSLTSCWHGTKSCWNLVKQFLMFLNPCSCQCNEDDEETQRLMKKAKRKRKRWLKNRIRKLQIYLSFKKSNFQIESLLKHSYMVNRIDQRKTYVWSGFYLLFLNMVRFNIIIVIWYVAKYTNSLIRWTFMNIYMK